MKHFAGMLWLLPLIVLISPRGACANGNPPPFEDVIQSLIGSTATPQQAAKAFALAEWQTGNALRSVPRLSELADSNDEFVSARAKWALYALLGPAEYSRRMIGTPAQPIHADVSNDDLNLLKNPAAADSAKTAAAQRVADIVMKAAFGGDHRAGPNVQPLGNILQGPAIGKNARWTDATDRRPEFDLPGDQPVRDWRTAGMIWNTSAAEFQKSLHSSVSSDRQRAIESLAALAAAQPTLLAGLDGNVRAKLVADLEAFDRIEPSMRLRTLFLVQQLGLDGVTLPLVLRSRADDNAEVRRIAQRFFIADRSLAEDRGLVRTLIAALLSPDLKIAAAAQSLLPKDLNDSFKDMLLQAVHEAGDDFKLDASPALRNLVIDMLVQKNDELGKAAAELLTTKASREPALESLVTAVNRGNTLSAPMLNALKPDVAEFSQLMLPLLVQEDLRIQRAAVTALVITGVKGAKLQTVLTGLLRNPDTVLRHAAAQALNTPQALARASVPELLGDLRSNDLTLRQLAARKLDELRVQPRTLTAALIRAVDHRDMPAREGLIAAIDSSNTNDQDAMELLKASAAQAGSPTQRIYARAAIHEIEAASDRGDEKLP